MAVLLGSLLIILGCSNTSLYQPPRVLPDDRQSIPEPRPRNTTVVQDAFEYAVVVPTAQVLDFARHIRSLSGKKQQALNVDAFDEVRDSSWFINRNAFQRLSLEEIARGPDKGTGPETEGPWEIFSAKVEGFTPGFNIIDARGDRYVIKFDPFGYQELSSSAEVITGKLFYAAGYYVPENYIVTFDPQILTMTGECLLENEKGVRCEMTIDDFNRIMQKVEPLPDGWVRALASKYLSGKPLGGFRYLGRRSDDPNDIIDHEYRRELRGMYVMCAWLKHFDIKDANSLDVYNDDGQKYIKHYLMDFGSTLGGAPEGPMDAFRGHETDFDTAAAFSNFFTLGLNVRDWEKAPEVEFPSVGRFSAIGFNPGKTAMNVLNPAFSMRTDLDGYWGAKLVMSFTDEQLQIVAREGRFSDPAAEAFLLNVLQQRRDMTGKYWFSRLNCLDYFSVHDLPSGLQELRFRDLGIEGDFWTEKETRYQCALRINGQLVKSDFNLPQGTTIQLVTLLEIARQSGKLGQIRAARNQWEVRLQISRNFGQSYGKGVKLYMVQNPQTEKFTLLGLEREN